MTALTVYPTASPSLLLPAAWQLTGTFTGTNYASPDILIGKATGWGELPAQGSNSAWLAAAQAPPPTGRGYILDDARLEGQTIAAGTWTAQSYHIMRSPCVADCVFRVFKRAADGTYTPLILFVASGVSWNTGQRISPAYAPVTAAALPFMSGDRLYLDIVFNITTHAHFTENFTDTEPVDATSGTPIPTVFVTTPGYGPTI